MHSLVVSSSDFELYASGYGCYYCLCGSSRFHLAGSSMCMVQLMFFYHFAMVLRSSIQAINLLSRVTEIEKLSILISSKQV